LALSKAIQLDKPVSELWREYELAAKEPTNLRYGYVRAG